MSLGELIAIDARQLAELLGLSVRTVRRLDSSAELPRPIRIGGAVRWRYEEIKAWIAADCPDRQQWESIKAQGGASRRARESAGANSVTGVSYRERQRRAPLTNEVSES